MAGEFVFGGFLIVWWLRRRIFGCKSSNGTNFSAISSGDDDCSSLFYGSQISTTGEGLPFSNHSIQSNEIKNLTTIRKEAVKLSTDLYRQVVWYLPVVCVDVILQRKSDNCLLLFWRRDKPAANIWWWPGGRMLKGETFYSAACRKIREETGNENLDISPVSVLKVWNTFFSDSSWDHGRDDIDKGCQTVNIIVICVIDDACDQQEQGQGQGQQQGKRTTTLFLKDKEKERSEEWAVEAHRWVSVEEALEPGRYDKYVRLNVEEALQKGFLTAAPSHNHKAPLSKGESL
jgi:ADP-ribose pyrophosphatase YjhB (NUDIX family)